MRGVPCRPPPSTTTRGTGGEAAGGWAQGSAEARPGARRRSSAAFLGGENGEGVGGSGTLASPHPLPAPGVPSRPAAAHLSPARPRVSAPRRGPLVSPPRRRGRGEAREETIWATYFPAPPCVCVRPAPRPGVPGGGRIFGGWGGGSRRLERARTPTGQRVRGGKARRDPPPERGRHRGRWERHQVEGWKGMSSPACCIA